MQLLKINKMKKLKIKNWENCKKKENIVNRQSLIYETNKCIYNFQHFETIRYFTKNTFGGKATLNDVNEGEAKLVTKFIKCNEQTKLRTSKDREKKNTYET